MLGFLRPRIVTPNSFQERFTPKEQAAILAHGRVRLARNDARINALTALLRCLCRFNPLIHFGARSLRMRRTVIQMRLANSEIVVNLSKIVAGRLIFLFQPGPCSQFPLITPANIFGE